MPYADSPLSGIPTLYTFTLCRLGEASRKSVKYCECLPHWEPPTPQAASQMNFDSTPAPNTQVFLASGIIVAGVDDWVIKLADVA